MPRWTRQQLNEFYEKRGMHWKTVPVAEGTESRKADMSETVINPERKTTDEEKLNKTERAFLNHLRVTGQWVGVQCITLKLAFDTRYTPDFWTMDKNGYLAAWEVKGGFFRDDAKVKIKVAARMYPMIKFTLVRKNSGSWTFEDVRP